MNDSILVTNIAYSTVKVSQEISRRLHLTCFPSLSVIASISVLDHLVMSSRIEVTQLMHFSLTRRNFDLSVEKSSKCAYCLCLVACVRFDFVQSSPVFSAELLSCLASILFSIFDLSASPDLDFSIDC